MKNKLLIIAGLVVILAVGAMTYLVKIFNPTANSWQTNLVISLAKLTDLAFIPYYFRSHSLPVYELSLNADNYVFLNQILPDPGQTNGILTADYKQSVPALFKFGGQEYDVEVHYRGFDFDHWTRPKKSWRIKFKNKQPFEGKTMIDLVIPEDRGLYLEALSNYRAKKLGLIVPDDQFVVLKVNGQTQGVYFEFERFSASFLERNNLPVGNFYADIDQDVSLADQQSIYSSLYFWKKFARDEVFKEDNYAEMALLLDLINNASDEEFKQKLPLILDINNFLTWQAHTVLMGSNHQDSFHNARLYWHPSLGKFIIFPWDVLGGVGWPIDYNPFVARVLKNPDWLSQRNQILTDYLADSNNLNDDLDYYDQLVRQTQTAIFQDYLKFFSNLGYRRQTKKFRQEIIDQVQLVKQALEREGLPDETGHFTFPLAVGKAPSSDKTILTEEFAEFDQIFNNNQAFIYGPGIHEINRNIVIPPGNEVKLLPGAKLIFAEKVSFLSYSPVIAEGAILTAKNPAKPWGVFAVISRSNMPSRFKRITVEYGSEAVVNGAYFTGALAVHGGIGNSVSGSVFRNNRGDDGLNIKYDSQVLVENNQFIKNDWDGLDLDFTRGEVRGNSLIGNGNDGLDFGSDSSQISNNVIDGSGDKCISLGETSTSKVFNNILKNCNYGIAVKDSSQPEIFNNQIIGNNIGLGSYQKKPIFPRKPFLFYDNSLKNNQVDFEEDDSSLRQSRQ